MQSGRPSLTLVRWINAPPAQVYAALTDPQKILRWWSPDAGPTVSATADARPGGSFRVVFRTEDGQEHTNHGVYREVVPGEKLVFTWHWLDPTERESLVTVRLQVVNGGTELTLIHAEFEDDETRDSHRDGWNGALDKLVALVAGPSPGEEPMLRDRDAVANLAVKDLGAARRFYEGTLGLEPVGALGDLVVYRSGKTTLNVYRSKEAGTNKATAVTWAVGDDLNSIVETLRSRGVTFEHYDMPGVTLEGDLHVGYGIKVAWFKDPDGNILNLVDR